MKAFVSYFLELSKHQSILKIDSMALSPPGATSLIQATCALRDMAQSDVTVTRSVSNEFGAAQDIVIGYVEKICLNSEFVLIYLMLMLLTFH